MRYLRLAVVLASTLAAVCGMPFGASGARDPLQAVFARMDRTSLSFKWMTASVQKTAYTAVIDETNTECGKIQVLRTKPHELKIRFDFDPDGRIRRHRHSPRLLPGLALRGDGTESVLK